MHRVYLHPLPLRIWHWTNAIGCVLLVLTGLQIRYVGLINVLSFHTAVVLHAWVGFVVAANFLLWLVFHLVTDQGRNYFAELRPVQLFLGCWRQLVYYSSGMFTGAKSPFHPDLAKHIKFNPLQGLTYQMVMLIFLPIQILTGILLWNVAGLEPVVQFLGGVRVVDTVHVLIFIVFVLYIPMHAYLAMLGRTTFEHYKAMLTGWEDEDDEGPAE
jgi:thiosulfate reductase cytochrome b subunit